MEIFDGKILRINLTTFNIAYEDFYNYKKYIGGRAVNQYILFNELPIRVTPFNPSNILAIGAGIFAGTNIIGASRLNIDSINVLTGGIGSSNSGGYFAEELRLAGINNIILKGKCPQTSYLYINDGTIKIIEAEDLKGMYTSDVKKILEKRHGNVRVLCIGPAGENLVRSANIIVDGARSASRCGLGAVMGSKNLKAIIVKGTGSIKLNDPDEVQKISDQWIEKLNSSDFIKRRTKYGVYCYEEPWVIEGCYRNFCGKDPVQAKRKKIMPDVFLKYKVGSKSCSACPIKCWAVHEYEENNEIIQVEEFQGDCIAGFAGKTDISEPKRLLQIHKLCNDLGLDEDNAAGAISWAMECYERGLLTKKDTNNIDLRWGNSEAVLKLLKDIALRKGFGNILAEGSHRASKEIGRGTNESSICVKGQELMEDLWKDMSWALGTVVSPRGGTHTRGAALSRRLENLDCDTYSRYFGTPNIGEPTDYRHKEKLVYFFERLHAFLDCVGICFFMSSWSLSLLLPEDYARMFSAATGDNISAEKLLYIGERAHNIEKAFNVLHTNWGRKEDMPPKRFMDISLDGKFKIDRGKWNVLLSRYYNIHEWDENGFPKIEILNKLGLNKIAVKLKERNRFINKR